MRRRYPLLAVLLLLPALQGAVAAVERLSADVIVDEVFGVAPIKSFMLQRDGELLIDAHRRGMSAERTTNVKSVAKSVLSLLVGIAIDRGYLQGVEQPIGDFFPEYFSARPDPEKQAITIQDLLTMRSGLASTSRRNYGGWVLSDNWAEYVLDRPLVGRPGGGMIYSTGSTHLLSVILTRASGMSTREFADRYLFGPLGIGKSSWDKDPQGYDFGGNNLALSPAALLKIGTLVLQRGVYDGQQVVPGAWIDESMQIYTRSLYNPYDYGYLWWQRELNGHTVQFAWGNGGQYLMILPALRTVVAIVSSSVGSVQQSRRSRRQLFEFIENRLIDYLNQT